MSMEQAIAIVGMGFRLPGASTVETLWPLLAAGVDMVGEVPAERALPFAHEGAPRMGAFLDDVAGFDAPFFGLKGLEARTTDPAQRLLLTVTWEAFEHGAIDPSILRGSDTGVFIGAHTDDYHELAVRSGFEVNAYWNAGLNNSILANRLSYFFDFHGPSMTVNTACSSSLEALTWAVMALRQGRCKFAVVGAANLILLPTVGLGAARAGMLSPQGRCKTFDKAADGFVRGEGVVSLILAPLNQARQEGLRILGLIRGVRSGHGGHATSLAAPNLKRQRDLIRDTYREAEIDAATITYLEAHGTGTRLGDSVEVEALKEAFGQLVGTSPSQHCGLGSLKSTMGHLEAAAGLAGIIKLCLAMTHRLKPPLAHFQELNPLIDLGGTPFYPQRVAEPWSTSDGLPRRAGLSGFGFGGSYAHVILEEAPWCDPPPEDKVKPDLLVLSARDELRLAESAARMLTYFQAVPGANLADICHSLRVGRQAMSVRLALVVKDREHAVSLLQAFGEGGISDASFSGTVTRKLRGIEMAEDTVLSDLARAWVAGQPLAWDKHFTAGRRLGLPLYPFACNRYWLSDSFCRETL